MPRPRTPVDTSQTILEPPALSGPMDWAALFGNDHPVELEVGSGKGLFLANAATSRPGHNFFGVEIAKKYAYQGAQRLAKAGLENAKMLAGDARQFMALHVRPQSLHAVHIYFPDPWWKARHKKRRVFCEGFVVDTERLLMPLGHLHVATDVEEYYGVIRELMDAHPRFTELPRPEPNTPEHELDYLTNFERKYRIEGRPIYRALYRFEA